jgi:hypothetical protein
MDYAAFLVILPLIVYILYEDWRDAAENRFRNRNE